MAAVAGTIPTGGVSNFSTVAGPKSTTAGAAIESCVIAVAFTGTYASGDNASIANVHTAIANSRRDGKTIAVVSAGFAAPGRLGGTQMGAKTVATSTNTVTCELTSGDMSTEWADGALATFGANATDERLKLFVTYTAT